jgi:hypothetical protein
LPLKENQQAPKKQKGLKDLEMDYLVQVALDNIYRLIDQVVVAV